MALWTLPFCFSHFGMNAVTSMMDTIIHSMTFIHSFSAVVPNLRETKGSSKLKRHPQRRHLDKYKMTEEDKEMAGPTVFPDIGDQPCECMSCYGSCVDTVSTVACLPCDIITALTTQSELSRSGDHYRNRSIVTSSPGRVANGPAPVNTRTDVLALQPKHEPIPKIPITTPSRKPKGISKQSSINLD